MGAHRSQHQWPRAKFPQKTWRWGTLTFAHGARRHEAILALRGRRRETFLKRCWRLAGGLFPGQRRKTYTHCARAWIVGRWCWGLRLRIRLRRVYDWPKKHYWFSRNPVFAGWSAWVILFGLFRALVRAAFAS